MKKLFFELSPILVFKINGNSMLPTFKPGQKVLVQKKWFFCKLRKGDAAVLKDPRDAKLILKRIREVRHSGLSRIHKRSWMRLHFVSTYQDDVQYYLLGDNPDESTDSRVFGWIDKSAIIGKVVYVSPF